MLMTFIAFLCFALVSLFSIPANILVIVIIFHAKDSLDYYHLLLVIQSFRDLIFNVFVNLYTIATIANDQIIFGQVACRFVAYLARVWYFGTTITLCAITCERYNSIKNCLDHNGSITKRRLLIIAISSIITFTVSLPLALGKTRWLHLTTIYGCQSQGIDVDRVETILFGTGLVVVFLVLPTILLIKTSINMHLLIRRHKKSIEKAKPGQIENTQPEATRCNNPATSQNLAEITPYNLDDPKTQPEATRCNNAVTSRNLAEITPYNLDDPQTQPEATRCNNAATSQNIAEITPYNLDDPQTQPEATRCNNAATSQNLAEITPYNLERPQSTALNKTCVLTVSICLTGQRRKNNDTTDSSSECSTSRREETSQKLHEVRSLTSSHQNISQGNCVATYHDNSCSTQNTKLQPTVNEETENGKAKKRRLKEYLKKARNLKIGKNVLLVNAGYLFSLLPIFGLKLYARVVGSSFDSTPKYIILIIYLVSHCCTIWNPAVNALRRNDFRQDARKLFKKYFINTKEHRVNPALLRLEVKNSA